MSCCAGREKGKVKDYHKWDYITLSDFSSSNCFTTLSYIWLWILALIAVAVYAADTFTAVNLLAYNKWSSQVKPVVPFDVSKWIFTGCILFSWALCLFEWIRAVQIMKRRSVSDDYLDPLASTLQCLRGGDGYRKFLVFAALTKSKKGNDYVALFAYFQFKSMIRIIVAQGPRQVINAITLYSVMKLQILHDNDATGLEKFWKNILELANQQQQQAVILFSMLFTFVIWVFSALSLIAAFILYVTFLWHFIPREDGTVSAYCRRKIEKRLENAVKKNYQKALEKEEARRVRDEVEAMKYGRKPPAPIRRPTLPVMGDSDSDLSSNPALSRTATQTSLPPYSARSDLTRMNTLSSVHTASTLAEPKLPSLEAKLPNIEEKQDEMPPTGGMEPTLPTMEPSLPNIGGYDRPQMPPRAFTAMSNASKASIASDTPLLARAGTMASAESRLLESAADAPMPSRPSTSNSFSRPLANGPPRSASFGPAPGGQPADPATNFPSRAVHQGNWNDPPMLDPSARARNVNNARPMQSNPTASPWPLRSDESFEMQSQQRQYPPQPVAPYRSEVYQPYNPEAAPAQRWAQGPMAPGPMAPGPMRHPATPSGLASPLASPPERSGTAPNPHRNDYFGSVQNQMQGSPTSSSPRGRFPVRPNTAGGWRPGPAEHQSYRQPRPPPPNRTASRGYGQPDRYY